MRVCEKNIYRGAVVGHCVRCNQNHPHERGLSFFTSESFHLLPTTFQRSRRLLISSERLRYSSYLSGGDSMVFCLCVVHFGRILIHDITMWRIYAPNVGLGRFGLLFRHISVLYESSAEYYVAPYANNFLLKRRLHE
jgi:hypothetical protein